MGTRGRALSKEVIERVIQLKKEGLSARVIAERMGLSKVTIYNIINQKRKVKLEVK